MKKEIAEAIEAVASHPKVSMGITAIFTSNVWLDYGEPILKGLTLILGTIVLGLLVIKHILDIKKEHFTKPDKLDKG